MTTKTEPDRMHDVVRPAAVPHIKDEAARHNSCGGCTACHMRTGIHSGHDGAAFIVSGRADGGSGIGSSCAGTFFQRHLGNSGLQALAGKGGRAATVQRKCSCGGSCGDREELEGVQAKLAIGPANDAYEQEADRVAEQVMRMEAPSLAADAGRTEGPFQIRRLGSSAEKGPATGISLGSGRPLSSSVREYMEPRFGMDFGHVQVHADSDAHRSAAAIQARAFTYGSHIWLGQGESEQNVPLMAHELTHTVQQGAGVSHIQAARLNCTSRKIIDVYTVNLPGSTRTIYDDLTATNNVLCQCGIEINPSGGETWSTNVLDLDAPLGVLNASTSAPSRELSQMLSYRPGGDVIHAYYVPAIGSGALAEGVASARFTPPLPDSLIVSNGAGAIPIVPAHELGHVLMNDGSHHANPNNLMAAGSVNTGAGELEQSQCNRMP